MAGLFQVLDMLEVEPSRLAKEKILLDHKLYPTLQKVMWYSLNPYITYGISEVNVTCLPIKGDSLDVALEAFFDILDRLSRRELTGNSAKHRVESFLSMVGSPRAVKWMSRILMKNLRIGVSFATVNKVWPGLVPGFSVQLANVFRGEVKKFPVIVDTKIDGLRLIAIKSGGDVKLYTRKGFEVDTLPNIVEALKAGNYDNVVLDGEVMGADWNESQSVVASKVSRVDPSNMKYNVFDAVPIKEWESQSQTEPLWWRKGQVAKLVGDIRSPSVVEVPFTVSDSVDDIMLKYRDLVARGFEGAMVKDSTAPYAFKRSDSILKVKPTVTVTGKVVGYERGTGKYEGMCGALTVSIDGVITSVGTGLTDSMRKDIAEDPNEYIGKMVEVEGQEATRDGKIRFPRLKGFRSGADSE